MNLNWTVFMKKVNLLITSIDLYPTSIPESDIKRVDRYLFLKKNMQFCQDHM